VGTERSERGHGPVGVAVVVQPHLEHGRAEVGLELGRRPLGDDPSLVDDGEHLGQAVGLLEVLGGQQHGGAVVDERLDHLPQVVAALGVEPGGGLVEEEDARAGHQRGSEVEASTHPARVRLEGTVGGVRQPELVEQGGDPIAHDRPAEVVEPTDHREVLAPGQVLVDRRVLAGQADERAYHRRFVDDVVAEDPGRAAVRPQDGGEDPDRCRLARAVGSEQAEDGRLFDGEADAVERSHLATTAKDFAEVVSGDGVRHGGAQSPEGRDVPTGHPGPRRSPRRISGRLDGGDLRGQTGSAGPAFPAAATSTGRRRSTGRGAPALTTARRLA
jgi:hypothetical protein